MTNGYILSSSHSMDSTTAESTLWNTPGDAWRAAALDIAPMIVNNDSVYNISAEQAIDEMFKNTVCGTYVIDANYTQYGHEIVFTVWPATEAELVDYTPQNKAAKYQHDYTHGTTNGTSIFGW